MNKVILYDSECPLCEAYTKGFVRLGILLPEQRIAFAALDKQEFIGRLDVSRQGNEIPLVDLSGGETLYGIDALLFLLSQKWKWIGKLFRAGFFYFIAKKFYSLVSYNRRIILPKNYCTYKHDCAPAFHLRWRLAFLVFAALFSAIVTWSFGNALAKIPQTAFLSGWKMLLVVLPGWSSTMLLAVLLRFSGNGHSKNSQSSQIRKSAQIRNSLAIAEDVRGRQLIDYLGHLAVLQITGVLLLVPSLALIPFAGKFSLAIAVVSVAASSAVMLRGHIKRVNVLGLSQARTVAWMLLMQSTAVAVVLYFYFKN